MFNQTSSFSDHLFSLSDSSSLIPFHPHHFCPVFQFSRHSSPNKSSYFFVPSNKGAACVDLVLSGGRGTICARDSCLPVCLTDALKNFQNSLNLTFPIPHSLKCPSHLSGQMKSRKVGKERMRDLKNAFGEPWRNKSPGKVRVKMGSF